MRHVGGQTPTMWPSREASRNRTAWTGMWGPMVARRRLRCKPLKDESLAWTPQHRGQQGLKGCISLPEHLPLCAVLWGSSWTHDC